MARTDLIDAINTRKIFQQAWVKNIQMPTDLVEANTCLHNGLLAFNSVFTTEEESYIEVVGVEIREKTNDTTPLKASLKLVFLTNDDAIATVGQDLLISDYDVVVQKPISFSSYTEWYNESGDVRMANSINNTTMIIKKKYQQNLYFVILAGDFITYASNTTLEVILTYVQH